MNKIFITLLCIASTLNSFSQNTVRGSVKGDNGEVLVGVTVVIQGTRTGAATDFDGNFTLDNVNANAILEFSYLGYTTKEVSVNGQSIINIVMTESSEQLDEIVIVGYGEEKLSELTTSAIKINTESIEKAPISNFDEALAGRAAGVQVTSTDGTPGQALNIVIRGGNSITGDNSPLYVVDGIPLEDFDPASISTADIETFQILKSTGATAIYGSRGANGVIIITTKGGRTDSKTTVSVGINHNIQVIPNRIQVLSPYQYVLYQLEGALALDNYAPINAGDSRVDRFYENWIDPELYRNEKGTSWQDEIFRLARTNRYNLGIRGGNETTTINLSSEYLQQDGTLINTSFKKILNNLKVTHKISEKSKLSANLQFAFLNREGANVRGDAFNSIIRDALQFRPIEPLNRDGFEVGGIDPGDPNQLFFFNPVKALNNTERSDRSEKIRGSVRFDQKITDKITSNTRVNYQIDNRRQNVFFKLDTQQGTRGNDGINGQVTMRRFQTLSASTTLQYKTKIKKNNIKVLGGFEFVDRQSEFSRFKNSLLPTDIFGIDKLGIGTAPAIPTTAIGGNRLASFFGRLNYNYKEKYFLTGVYRADGSSKFPNNKWGYFPSVSLAWRFDKESFIKNSEIISSGKLRVDWGKAGNNRVGDFVGFSQIDINSGSGYVWGSFGETFIPGAYQSNLAVPDLRWETTEQIDFGIDFGLFNDRITGTIDYYRKETTDLLLNAEMSLSTGFDKVQQNVGAVENKGLEVLLSSVNVNNPNFKWKTSFNISFNKNKTLSLNSGQSDIKTDPEWSNSFREFQYITEVGQPVGMMYGLEFDGIYQVSDFVGGTTLQDGIPDNGTIPVAPGSVKFVDQNGDGTINVDDRVIIGNPYPKHFGGLTNDFQIGNFDLQVLLQWSYDFDILNANQAEFTVPRFSSRNAFPSVLDAWSPTNSDGTRNSIRYLNVTGSAPAGNRIDNRYVEDGTYLRLKTVSLGYSLPSDVVEKIGLNSIRLSLSGQNLITWTDYSGYNPDVSVGRFGALTPNLDWSAYPQSFTVLTGVNITF